MPENIEINKKNYNDHKNIFEAIIDRDPDQAEALTEAHLKTAWQYVKLVF
jgi:DNA-binding FadR family transcriptional regulator